MDLKTAASTRMASRGAVRVAIVGAYIAFLAAGIIVYSRSQRHEVAAAPLSTNGFAGQPSTAMNTPAVFDRDVFAFDKACFLEAVMKAATRFPIASRDWL